MARRKLSVRFKALTILCTDLARSVRFYQNVLGAAPLRQDESGGGPWYTLGSLTITLVPNAAERSPADFPTHAMPMLWLEVDDLEMAHARCGAAGVEIVAEPDELFMMIADPDGLLIEVWQSDGEPEAAG